MCFLCLLALKVIANWFRQQIISWRNRVVLGLHFFRCVIRQTIQFVLRSQSNGIYCPFWLALCKYAINNDHKGRLRVWRAMGYVNRRNWWLINNQANRNVSSWLRGPWHDHLQCDAFKAFDLLIKFKSKVIQRNDCVNMEILIPQFHFPLDKNTTAKWIN